MPLILPWCFTLLMVAGAACAAELSGPQIIEKVRTPHPRLMMRLDSITAIRTNLSKDPWLESRYEIQKNAADRILTQPVSRYEIPDGLRLLATSRRVLERVATLAIVYRVTSDTRYLDRCWAELEAA